MANKRQLKKTIDLVTGTLLVECVAAMHFDHVCPQEDIDSIMTAALRLQDDMIRRVSHPEPGMPARKFFKNLREELLSTADELAGQIYAIG